MRPSYRRAVALILSPLIVTGCYTSKLVTTTPAEYLQTHSPKRVRIVQRDQSEIDLYNPELRGDSIWGQAQVRGRVFSEDTVRTFTFAVSDIQRLEERRFSPVRTVGMTLAVAIVALAAYGVVAFRVE